MWLKEEVQTIEESRQFFNIRLKFIYCPVLLL